MIIDHLHNDKKSLRNCSVASKKLSHASRFHLFHRICVDSDRTNLGFVEFAEFLQSDSPAAKRVHELCLRAGWGSPSSGPHCVGPSMLALISRKCPSLQSLALKYICWDRETSSSGSTPFDSVISSWTLKSLTLKGLCDREGVCDVSNIHHILSYFAKAESLHLNIRVLDPGTLAASPSFAELEVESLTINGSVHPNLTVFDFCRAICATRTSHSLRHLHIHVRCDSNEYFRLLDIFVGECPSLEDITLDLREYTRMSSSESTQCFNITA